MAFSPRKTTTRYKVETKLLSLQRPLLREQINSVLCDVGKYFQNHHKILSNYIKKGTKRPFDGGFTFADSPSKNFVATPIR